MLTGFGCASDATDIPYDGAGTEQYRAPEQVEGRTHGRAVDYWGCGIIRLELILRRPVESRIVPGGGLTYYQKVLGDLQDSPLARCSRKMLEEAPGSRLTAIDALLDPRGPKTGGARIDAEVRCHPPECIFTNDVDLIEVHSDNGAADLMADIVAIDESSIVDGATGDSHAQVDSTNGLARSSSIDLVDTRSDNDSHAHVNESVVGMTGDQYTTESNKRRKLMPCEIVQRTSG
ncbi:hypothetical protein PENFLA_c001G00027 [Penicillium flavigenum]|uniref:Protein kinase domain-containing protein n=1 Tax=Penicillium flavigenum TaxID=254877 RepID=A0A1V6U390_9EURO|nr:hypothetical protein PENFLA_c001G00027 [Penicillium flavigenum]